MLLGTLGASFLGNILAGKGIVRASYGNKHGKGIVRAGYEYQNKILIPLHSLTNFEMQKYYQNEPRFKEVYSRDKLPKRIKDEAHAINLD